MTTRRELRSAQSEAKELRGSLQKQVLRSQHYQKETQAARLRACETDKDNRKLRHENKALQQIIKVKESRIEQLSEELAGSASLVGVASNLNVCEDQLSSMGDPGEW